jgi:uncharacterized membrane protein HdeD (DUF308 family)
MAYIIHQRNPSSINMGDYLRKNWGWFLALGILLMGLGFLSLGFTITATILSVLTLGIILLAVGIIQIIEGIKTRKWGGFFLHLIVGLLYLFSGGMLLFNPGLSAFSLTFVLGVFYISVGLFRTVSSLVMRFRQWGWTFFSGLLSIGLGLMILYSWPFSGLWIIGLFVGIDLLFYGISILSFAIAAHRRERLESSAF